MLLSLLLLSIIVFARHFGCCCATVVALDVATTLLLVFIDLYSVINPARFVCTSIVGTALGQGCGTTMERAGGHEHDPLDLCRYNTAEEIGGAAGYRGRA